MQTCHCDALLPWARVRTGAILDCHGHQAQGKFEKILHICLQGFFGSCPSHPSSG